MDAPRQMSKSMLDERRKKDLKKRRARRVFKEQTQLVLSVNSSDYVGKKVLVKQAGTTSADLAKDLSAKFNEKLRSDAKTFMAASRDAQIDAALSSAKSSAALMVSAEANRQAQLAGLKAAVIAGAVNMNRDIDASFANASEENRGFVKSLAAAILEDGKAVSDLQAKLLAAQKAGSQADIDRLNAELAEQQKKMTEKLEDAGKAAAAAAAALQQAAAEALAKQSAVNRAAEHLLDVAKAGFGAALQAINNAVGILKVQFPELNYMGEMPVTFCTGFTPRDGGIVKVFNYETGEIFDDAWPTAAFCHEQNGYGRQDFQHTFKDQHIPGAGFTQPYLLPVQLVQRIFFDKPKNGESAYYANIFLLSWSYIAPLPGDPADIYWDHFIEMGCLKVFIPSTDWGTVTDVRKLKSQASILMNKGATERYSDLVQIFAKEISTYKTSVAADFTEFKAKLTDIKSHFKALEVALTAGQQEDMLKYFIKIVMTNPSVFLYNHKSKTDLAAVDAIRLKLKNIQGDIQKGRDGIDNIVRSLRKDTRRQWDIAQITTFVTGPMKTVFDGIVVP